MLVGKGEKKYSLATDDGVDDRSSKSRDTSKSKEKG